GAGRGSVRVAAVGAPKVARHDDLVGAGASAKDEPGLDGAAVGPAEGLPELGPDREAPGVGFEGVDDLARRQPDVTLLDGPIAPQLELRGVDLDPGGQGAVGQVGVEAGARQPGQGTTAGIVRGGVPR